MAKAKKKATKKKGRSPKIKLPASRPRGRAGRPPPGCIGPPDPLPLFSDADMIQVVRDAAGIPLDKEVAERLVYMLRRAHGIGLAEGSRRGNPNGLHPPQHEGGRFVDTTQRRIDVQVRRDREKAERERAEANRKTMRRAMMGT